MTQVKVAESKIRALFGPSCSPLCSAHEVQHNVQQDVVKNWQTC